MVRRVQRGRKVLLEYRVRQDPRDLRAVLDLPATTVLQEQQVLRARLVAQVRQARQDRLGMMAELVRLGLRVQ